MNSLILLMCCRHTEPIFNNTVEVRFWILFLLYMFVCVRVCVCVCVCVETVCQAVAAHHYW